MIRTIIALQEHLPADSEAVKWLVALGYEVKSIKIASEAEETSLNFDDDPTHNVVKLLVRYQLTIWYIDLPPEVMLNYAEKFGAVDRFNGMQGNSSLEKAVAEWLKSGQ